METINPDMPVVTQLNSEEEKIIQSVNLLLIKFKSNSLLRICKIKSDIDRKFLRDIFCNAIKRLVADPRYCLVISSDKTEKRDRVSFIAEKLIDQVFNEKVEILLNQKNKLKNMDIKNDKIFYEINRNKKTIKFCEKINKKNHILSVVHTILYFYKLEI